MESIVRNNLLSVEGYTPYCGNIKPYNSIGGCRNPRTRFDGEQFVCPYCGWRSRFPEDFITQYKQKLNERSSNQKS